ncbi:cytochrome P450 [Phenylobacterium sp.]|uniref:cytochrome P450 n=1 Tax=Phenylobacterium sp. TaxID=1871053 RepID=UPI00286CC9A6|nr:cytochrome P450 [Phenylobacterium sp.]
MSGGALSDPRLSTLVLRPRPPGLKGWITGQVMVAAPLGLGLLRRFAPLPRFGNLVIATLHDDVVEVFATDAAFAAPYRDKLDVITGGEPFFLGLADGPEYRGAVAAMRRVVRPDDLPGLARQAEALAEKAVAGAGGRIEVVDALVREVTFKLLGDYLGVPPPPKGDIRVWATRLFEFQFADPGGDPALRVQVDAIAPAMRAHIQGEMDRRRATGAAAQPDDVLGRCLALQAAGESWYTDAAIRTAIACLMVGGPPQPPMVVPQALEQLLRRPEALADAQRAARDGDDDLLAGYVLEAMRFDPLAPGLPRHVAAEATIAAGTRRARTVPAGATVLAAFASAMMDARRLPDPKVFNPRRLAYEYIHFGHGLHECFGRHINRATLHLMLKPLLRRPNLRRAPGPAGRLSKNGVFAERLVVEFD